MPVGCQCQSFVFGANSTSWRLGFGRLSIAPSHLAVTFDHSMESFRNELEPDYKAQRGEPPDDLEPRQVRLLLGLLGFAQHRAVLQPNLGGYQLVGKDKATLTKR